MQKFLPSLPLIAGKQLSRSSRVRTSPPAGIGNAYELTIYIASYNQRPNIRRDISSRSDGQSVRCAEDERHNETL